MVAMEEIQKTIKAAGHTYHTIKKLGAGLTGDVFLVTEEGVDTPRALKLLNPEAYKGGQLDFFKREFSVLCELHHPHLCRVYDFGFSEDENKYFFTSEYVEGTELYKCTDLLSPIEIQDIFVQIADGLGAVHAAGLIHFDIKGANILITQVKGKPFAKIVDFGLATPAVETPKFVAGTVRYISPEMVTKSHAIDYRADLYSLGIVLYRMLAKRYPNQGGTVEEILKWHTRHQLIDDEALKKAGTPRYLIDVVQKLINSIPTNRFSSANVLITFIELHSGRAYKKSQREQLTSLIEEGPLVGRDDLMRNIRMRIGNMAKKDAPPDKNQAVAIAGPTGIGKSRILKEMKYIAELSEVGFVEIRAGENGESLSRLKDGFKFSPVCILVDDFEKLGPNVQKELIGILNHLYAANIRGTKQKSLIVMTTTIPSENDPLAIPVELGVDVVRLKALGRDDIAQYIRQFLGEPNPPESQIDEVVKYSGGLPELMRIAVAGIKSPTAKTITDINRIFTDRIKKLSEPARALFAVIGLSDGPIRPAAMENIMGGDVSRHLPELTRSGLIQYDRKSEGYLPATGAITHSITKLLSDDEIKKAGDLLLAHTEIQDAGNVDAIVKYATLCKPDGEIADYLLRAAEFKDTKGEVDDAYDYYIRFLEKIPNSDDRRPQTLRKLAKASVLTGNLDKTVQFINEAAALTSKITDDYISLSWVCRLRGNPKEALEYIESAIKLLDPQEQKTLLLRITNEKAECFMQMGDFASAEDLFRNTWDQASKLSDRDKTAVPNNNLGLVVAARGETNEAIKIYKQKLAIFASDKRISASILSRLGYIYQQADRLSESYETYKQSLALALETGDTHNASIILGNLICICQSKALFSDALNYAEENLKLSSQALSRKGLGSSFLVIGGLYIHLGLEDVAERYLNEALKIFQEIGDKTMEEWTELSLGFLFRNLGNYQNAIAKTEGVIKAAQEMSLTQLHTQACHDIADLYIDLEDFASAAEYISKIEHAWPGKETARETDILFELLRCKLRALGEPSVEDSTIERILELNELALRKGLPEPASETFYLLGKIFDRRGDKDASLSGITEAKAIIDNIAASLSEEYRDSYLKQRFRKNISDESVKLSGSFETEVIGTLDKTLPRTSTTKNLDRTADLSGGISDKTTDLKK